MTIYLDFDGTVVEHAYPRLGAPNPKAIEVIKRLIEAGHKIILNTYRAVLNGEGLQDAIKYLAENGIVCDEVLDGKMHPPKWDWDSHIMKHVIFIDDVALNMPLIKSTGVTHLMVNWEVLDKQFQYTGMYERVSLPTT